MGPGKFAIYDVASGELLLEQTSQTPPAFIQGIPVPDGALSSGASENGRYIASASRNFLFLYDVPANTQGVLDEFCRMQKLNPLMSDEPCRSAQRATAPLAELWVTEQWNTVTRWFRQMRAVQP